MKVGLCENIELELIDAKNPRDEGSIYTQPCPMTR